ncbi:hypothetical protein, partial [Burkholderia ubonensis]|uniref:hypothetical protein n=1 Tax=Burkholderia ubonensis TaxID=101571 RepID=UPI001E2A8FB0
MDDARNRHDTRSRGRRLSGAASRPAALAPDPCGHIADDPAKARGHMRLIREAARLTRRCMTKRSGVSPMDARNARIKKGSSRITGIGGLDLEEEVGTVAVAV